MVWSGRKSCAYLGEKLSEEREQMVGGRNVPVVLRSSGKASVAGVK